MSISVEKRADNVLAIVLGNQFDFESVGPFRQSYESMEQLEANQVVEVDFSDTRFIDSSALGMLINAKSHFDKLGAKLVLTNTNDTVKKIFSISHFDKKFDIS